MLAFSPCGSQKTLVFMTWLGIRFPRWLHNELCVAADPSERSLALCERIFLEVWSYAQERGIPLGVKVQSVSIRKAEIDASVELLQTLRARMRRSGSTASRATDFPRCRCGPNASLEEIGASPAVRLLRERAGARMRESLDGERASRAVAEICRRLDGLSLAIELAAARVAGLDLQDISAHLDDLFHLLP